MQRHHGAQLPRKKEKGTLTVLRLAKPGSAEDGILNIQAGTLITATRMEQSEADYCTNDRRNPWRLLKSFKQVISNF